MAKGRKTGGRQPGSRNKATQDIRDIARGFVDDPVYREALRKRLLDGVAGTMELHLWAYGYGRPGLATPADGSVPTSITIHF